MKKNLVVFLSFAFILLAGCNNSKVSEIDTNTRTSTEGASAESVYNQQIDEAQYIQDLEDFISYDILLNIEDKPFISDLSLVADFDSQSSVQGGVSYSQQKYSKSRDLESREIDFDIRAEEPQNDSEPFYASGSLSLIYQNNEMYANIHDFGVYMGEGNMLAKMYTLLGQSYEDKWIDLEVNSGGFITIDNQSDTKLQYILGILKNVLKSERINEDSPNFLNGVAELIDTANSYIDLGISTDGLSLQSVESIKYFELNNGIVQKEFVGNFQGDISAFDLSFMASKQGLQIRLYNIKHYDEDIMDYKDTDQEFSLSIQENKKSDYSIKFKSLKARQVIADIDGNIKYGSHIKFNGKFVLEPLELIQGQKISGKIEGTINKKSPSEDEIFHEVSGETVSFTEILSLL